MDSNRIGCGLGGFQKTHDYKTDLMAYQYYSPYVNRTLTRSKQNEDITFLIV